MATFLKIDAATLPRMLALDPPVTEAEFEALCRENDNIRLERSKEGVVRINPPTGGWTGSGNQEIAGQLYQWWRPHEKGRIFDSSTGFRLPDGSTLSPDVSYASPERLRDLPGNALRGFPRICPDFVIELVSESDLIEYLQEKMNRWIANGADLAWLVDPYQRTVLVYRPGRAIEVVSGESIAAEAPVEGFILDLSRIWKCYKD